IAVCKMVNCGLVTSKNEPVTLKSIEVNLQAQGHVATVSSTLQYVNEEQGPVEALFVFPMPAEAALCHFSAKIADQEVVAEVQEKEKARELYDDSLSSGEQAFLLEESEESVDVFRLSVGCLPPGQSAAVTFVYVTELSVQADHSLRFCLPVVLNPRYSPPGASDGIVSEITPGSAQIPYSLSLTAHLSSPNPIAKVESKCPLKPVEFLNADHTQAKVSLCAGHKFDRDVELFLYYQNTHQPTAIVEAGVPTAQPGSLMGDSVVMLSLYPEFPEAVTSMVSSCGEFVFVMDRSGSMSCEMHNGLNAEERIKSARNTLLLLLKSLPMGCYFNIYGFGSHYESFFPKSVEYSQETMDQVVQRVKQMQADMGGTEILQPLKHIYSQPCIPNHPRQVFIFTDGEVGNTKDVLQLVRSNADSHRCFSFGIGEGASTALITGMAQEGSGHAQFITGADRMQSKVMQSLRYALQPAVTDIAEVWSVPEGMSVTLLSPPVKVLFNGQRALIYAQLKGKVRDFKMLFITALLVGWILIFFLSFSPAMMAMPHMLRCSGGGSLMAMPKMKFRSRMPCMAPMASMLQMAPDLNLDADPLLQLISLQEASGCWKMESTLAQVFGKTIEEVTKQMPAEVEPGIWATVLALIWLHGFKMDAHDEWQFLAIKAVSWIRSRKVANLSECVLAANAVLQCQVKEEALGF
uniref:VIT domain-containing protein n=1 Tax=Electrophorus electricus TaxID=8005 RepID=A0AAY5F2K5_ELEEL